MRVPTDAGLLDRRVTLRLTRRGLLYAGVGFAGGLAMRCIPAANARPDLVSDGLCVGVAPDWHKLSPALQRRVLSDFAQLGFGSLRAGFGRRGGSDDERRRRISLVQQAVAAGYRLKLQIGGWSGNPDRFEREHPDARIVDQRGNSPPPGYVSPWYPGLKALLRDNVSRAFAEFRELGLLPAVSAFIADLGPAGEPIYPATWIVHETRQQATFWFYDVHAQAAFGRDMQRLYGGDLPRANQLWGTRFADWSEVRIPEPGTRPGPLWRDVLNWYRDSKRDIISHQVQVCRAEIAAAYGPARGPLLLLLVPGSHLAPDAMAQAVQSGDGSYDIKLMIDTEWLLQLAAAQGCGVQHTAVQDEREVRYIAGLLRAQGGRVPFEGENAKGKPAQDPGHLADVVLRNGLYGLDYINAASVLQPDGVTPNEVMPRLAQACARMLQVLPTRAIR